MAMCDPLWGHPKLTSFAPHLSQGCSWTSTGTSPLAPHGGAALVGLWRGEGCCCRSWEDVGITAALWKAKPCTAQVGGRRGTCSSVQHGAAGAPRNVLPHLDCALHIASLPLGETGQLRQAFECGKDPLRKAQK